MAQGDGRSLCSTRMQVQSFAQHSELKEPVLLQLQWNLVPGLGTPYAMGQPKMKKKKKKKKAKNKTFILSFAVEMLPQGNQTG